MPNSNNNANEDAIALQQLEALATVTKDYVLQQIAGLSSPVSGADTFLLSTIPSSLEGAMWIVS